MNKTEWNIKRWRKYCLVATVIGMAMGVTPTQADPMRPGDWDRVRLYGHGFRLDVDFDGPQYYFIKNNFHFFTIEKRHARMELGAATTEISSQRTGAKIKNRGNVPLFYWNAELAHVEHYASMANLAANGWLENRSYVPWLSYKWEEPGLQDWWVDTAATQVETGKLLGLFIDAVPKADVKGKIDIVHNMLDQLKARLGPDKPIIYNGFYYAPNVGGGVPGLRAGMDTLNHTDGVYVEAFQTSNIVDAASARMQLDELLSVTSDKIIICRGTSDGYGTAGLAANEKHKYSLASFLIVANNNSFYLFQDTYEYPAGEPESVYNHADFSNALGAPLGVAEKLSNNLYRRYFEHAYVQVNVNTQNAFINWY